jgi:hypothetical protein
MTESPFTTVVPQEEKKRDASEFIPWMRCAEMVTPLGLRPGKVLIIRPLEQIEDFRPPKEGQDPSAWRGRLTIADIACLDPIDPTVDPTYGTPIPGFAAGTQFRDQVVFPGYLNKAFREYLGKTVIGLVYLGVNTKGKPPLHFRDLSAQPEVVTRGQRFLVAFPDFLIPKKAEFTSTEPAQNPGYSQDPWTQSAVPQSAPPAARPANTLQQLEQWRAAQEQQPTDPPF